VLIQQRKIKKASKGWEIGEEVARIQENPPRVSKKSILDAK
jgi:hypothetical protein